MRIDDDLRRLLIDRRKQLFMTQGDVADRMGTAKSAVSDLETGRNLSPTTETVQRWASAVLVEATVTVAVEARPVTPPIQRAEFTTSTGALQPCALNREHPMHEWYSPALRRDCPGMTAEQARIAQLEHLITAAVAVLDAEQPSEQALPVLHALRAAFNVVAPVMVSGDRLTWRREQQLAVEAAQGYPVSRLTARKRAATPVM